MQAFFRFFYDQNLRKVASEHRIDRKCYFFLPPLILSPEMECLNDILVDVSGHKLDASQTRVFVWFFTLIFPFCKMLFMNRL